MPKRSKLIGRYSKKVKGAGSRRPADFVSPYVRKKFDQVLPKKGYDKCKDITANPTQLRYWGYLAPVLSFL
ncbi:hypothetical protein J6590_013324 [Homalodisca vitripennis]|nr:hypothetical protein J6590_013324 [Homalodisca vitripennis]